MKPPIVSVYLPDNLPHGAYAAIMADTAVEGEAVVRFRFGDADYWVYPSGMTVKIGDES
jgi:hypothetical protein